MAKQIRMYQIDSFTDEIFAGNPAAVCPLDAWLSDDVMQAIAAENNVSETAFFVADGDRFHIRWFAPLIEVKLCGHATLASAFVIMTETEPTRHVVHFDSKSGPLSVTKSGDRLAMDFPAWRLKRDANPPAALVRGLGREPQETWIVDTDDNYYAVFASESDVRALTPDFSLLEQLHPAGVVATAPGEHSDFVSRYFAPSFGINEDPATGSTHCGLTPYWAERLGKDRLHAKQVSARGADLWCENQGERVVISGRAVKYLEGTINM